MAKFYRYVFKVEHVDVKKIESLGLLAVKIGQILALRPDVLSTRRCVQLQALYQHASYIPQEESMSLLNLHTSKNYLNNFKFFDKKPFASASIGQVHDAILKSGKKVVVKIIKSDFEGNFKSDVNKMRFWLGLALFFYPKLKKVGNPLGLLNYIESYTLKELDLKNEIKGQNILKKKAQEISKSFPMKKLHFPKIYESISNSKVLVMEKIESPTIEELIMNKKIAWKDLLELFRIHGTYMFGIGTFHGDLHPGNMMMDKKGKFSFIDTSAISDAPTNVRKALFGFFENLSQNNLPKAFDALLLMVNKKPSPNQLKKYYKDMEILYADFIGKKISEVSLTNQMMHTIKIAVEAGCSFGEDTFPIIRSLMYLDGLVLRSYPDVDLITSMGPYIKEIKKVVN